MRRPKRVCHVPKYQGQGYVRCLQFSLQNSSNSTLRRSQLRNSAFGSKALWQNPTRAGNSAFGKSALLANSTGLDNTASLYLALQANTEGNCNTALGARFRK